MKRLVLCFDCTWNKPADDNIPADMQVETNARRFFESVHSLGARCRSPYSDEAA